MKVIISLLLILLFVYSSVKGQALAAHAGVDFTQGDSLSFTILNGSATGGTPPYTYAWRCYAKPNGNGWCGNILNPTSATTEVLYTGVFSSPFGTPYSYSLQVTDNVGAIALDSVIVTVTYSTPAPPQATGAGWHYVTSADSIADPLKQMSPSRKDIWIDGASTDRYAAGGTKNSAFDLRNLFGTYPDQRIFVEHGKYFYGNLYINKDSCHATSGHPWRLVPHGGQVEFFSSLTFSETIKYLVVDGSYNVTYNTGSPSYQGHANGRYAFSSGTYGFFFNNGWKNIDAAGMDFGSIDSLHDVEIQYCQGPMGGSFFVLMGNPSKSSSVYNIKIHDNLGMDSQAEMYYIGRTQSDPQQEFDSVEIYNNRFTRSGLEIDQFGQNGVNNYEHNNVYWLSATNWISPFDINQAFDCQRYYRKNGNKIEGSIFVGAGEQVMSLISNKPSAVTLTTDTNYIRKSIVFNGRGAKDIFLGSQNAAVFNFVLDSLYLGFRPPTYLASKVYNNTSNNFSSLPQAALTQQNFSPNITINWRHIRYDTTGKKTALDAAVSSTVYSDTARVNSLNPLSFVNCGFGNITTFPNIFSRWVDTIYNTFKNENAPSDVNWNQPYAFNLGDYVQHCGLIYQSKVSNNQGHPPTGVTDSYWTLVTWTKPDGSISLYPPDDLRLPVTDFYAKQSIGLLDQYYGNLIKIPYGSKIIAH